MDRLSIRMRWKKVKMCIKCRRGRKKLKNLAGVEKIENRRRGWKISLREIFSGGGGHNRGVGLHRGGLALIGRVTSSGPLRGSPRILKPYFKVYIKSLRVRYWSSRPRNPIVFSGSSWPFSAFIVALRLAQVEGPVWIHTVNLYGF